MTTAFPNLSPSNEVPACFQLRCSSRREFPLDSVLISFQQRPCRGKVYYRMFKIRARKMAPGEAPGSVRTREMCPQGVRLFAGRCCHRDGGGCRLAEAIRDPGTWRLDSLRGSWTCYNANSPADELASRCLESLPIS